METIEVRYKPIGDGNSGAFHKYIVYTNENGIVRYARGGPTPDAIIGFGTVKTEHGFFSSQTIDYPTVGVTHGTEVIATAPDLSSYWANITERMDQINASNYVYGPTSQNSNAVVDDALNYAGMPSPQLDNYVMGEYFSPGSDVPFILPVLPLSTYVPPDWLLPAREWFGEAPQLNSPLVLDLDGDGIETTAMGYGVGASSTYFDLDNNGFAQRTGWVTGGDGLLAIDLNSNGKIDNQNELFGNNSTYADGFAALNALDSNHDGKITSADSAWANLKVWVDADGDALTDTGELKTLSSLNITQINLNATALSNVYNNENAVSASSTFVMNGVARNVSDVWFRNDQIDTRYLGNVVLNEKTFFLPTLKGFGNIKDLHVAMSQNAPLLTLVENFVNGWSPGRFLNSASLDSDVQAILYKWAGVENVSPTSRGPYVDGQLLAFMETLTGKQFATLTTPSSPDPTAPAAVDAINQSYNMAFDAFKAQLITQAGGQLLFNQAPVYNVMSGDLVGGELTAASIAVLQSQASGASDKAAYWKAIGEYFLNVKALEDFSSAETAALNSAIAATSSSLSWTSVVASVMAQYSGLNLIGTDFADHYGGTHDVDYFYGGGGNDILEGQGGNDQLNGVAGNDIVDGGAGNDILQGGAGDDTLIGGAGNDEFYDDAGNDTYFFGAGFGSDYVQDESGTDVIAFGAGIALPNLRFWVLNNNDLIVYNGSDQISFSNHFRDRNFGTSNYNEVESIRFADNSTFNLMGNFTFTGTSAAEAVVGTAGVDTLVGLAGNDELYGGQGNDTYFLGAGFGSDYIQDEGGADVIAFGAGITLPNLRFWVVNNNDLIVYNGSDQISLSNHFKDRNFGTNNYNEVESIRFADNSTFNLMGNFTFTGTSGAEAVVGTAGVDTLIGLASNDELYGGQGNDTYLFNTGFGRDYISDDGGAADVVKLGAGLTTENITLSNYSTYDTKIVAVANVHDITLSNQRNTGATSSIETLQFSDGFKANLLTYGSWVWGTSSAQTTAGTANADTIFGRGGNDTVNGNDGNDAIHGGSGTDTLNGGNGDDQLNGGINNDTLNGGANNDILFGADGLDNLTGGTGADTFMFTKDSAFNNVDVITDFSKAQSDKINLADVLDQYNPLTHAITDFVQITTSGGNSLLKVDIDGGANSFVQIATINGVTGLTDEAALVSSGHLIAA